MPTVNAYVVSRRVGEPVEVGLSDDGAIVEGLTVVGALLEGAFDEGDVLVGVAVVGRDVVGEAVVVELANEGDCEVGKAVVVGAVVVEGELVVGIADEDNEGALVADVDDGTVNWAHSMVPGMGSTRAWTSATWWVLTLERRLRKA